MVTSHLPTAWLLEENTYQVCRTLQYSEHTPGQRRPGPRASLPRDGWHRALRRRRPPHRHTGRARSDPGRSRASGPVEGRLKTSGAQSAQPCFPVVGHLHAGSEEGGQVRTGSALVYREPSDHVCARILSHPRQRQVQGPHTAAPVISIPQLRLMRNLTHHL